MPPYDLSRIGAVLVIVGAVAIVAGLLLSSGAVGFLSWFGRLPGDIRIDGPGYRIRVPVVSALLISLALSVIINIINMFRRQ